MTRLDLAFVVRCNGRDEAAFRTLPIAKQWVAQRQALICEPADDLTYTIDHLVPGGKVWTLRQAFTA